MISVVGLFLSSEVFWLAILDKFSFELEECISENVSTTEVNKVIRYPTVEVESPRERVRMLHSVEYCFSICIFETYQLHLQELVSFRKLTTVRY